MKLDPKLLAALEKCRETGSEKSPNFSAISREFEIGRSTLSRHYHAGSNGDTVKSDHAYEELLDEAQRHLLIQRSRILAQRGLYPTPAILRNLAGEIAGRRPGHDWPSRFLEKYGSDFISVVIQGMEKSRHTA